MYLPEKAELKNFKKGGYSFTKEKGILTYSYHNGEMIGFNFNNGNGPQRIEIKGDVFNYLMDHGDFIKKVYSEEVVLVQFQELYIVPVSSPEYKSLTERTIVKKELKPGWECIIKVGNETQEVQYYGDVSVISLKCNFSNEYFCVSYKNFVFRDKSNGNFMLFYAKKEFIVTEILSEISLLIDDVISLETMLAARFKKELYNNSSLLQYNQFKNLTPSINGSYYNLSKEDYLKLCSLRDQQKKNVEAFLKEKAEL